MVLYNHFQIGSRLEVGGPVAFWLMKSGGKEVEDHINWKTPGRLKVNLICYSWIMYLPQYAYLIFIISEDLKLRPSPPAPYLQSI